MNKDTPITFEAPSFAIFDIAQNAVRTTEWGSLAVFSTRIVANLVCARMPGCKVVPVWIKPAEEQ